MKPINIKSSKLSLAILFLIVFIIAFLVMAAMTHYVAFAYVDSIQEDYDKKLKSQEQEYESKILELSNSSLQEDTQQEKNQIQEEQEEQEKEEEQLNELQKVVDNKVLEDIYVVKKCTLWADEDQEKYKKKLKAGTKFKTVKEVGYGILYVKTKGGDKGYIDYYFTNYMNPTNNVVSLSYSKGYTNKKCNVYNIPSIAGDKVGKLSKKTRFEMIYNVETVEDALGWTKILAENGCRGYISDRYIIEDTSYPIKDNGEIDFNSNSELEIDDEVDDTNISLNSESTIDSNSITEPETTSNDVSDSSSESEATSTTDSNSNSELEATSTTDSNSSSEPEVTSTTSPNSSSEQEVTSTTSPNSSGEPEVTYTTSPNSSSEPEVTSTTSPNSSSEPEVTSTTSPNSSSEPEVTSTTSPNSSSKSKVTFTTPFRFNFFTNRPITSIIPINSSTSSSIITPSDTSKPTPVRIIKVKKAEIIVKEVTTTKYCTIYEDSTKKSNAIGHINSGCKAKVLSIEDNGYLYVKVGKTKGYIHYLYTTFTKNVKPKEVDTNIKYAKVNGVGVNLRSAPGVTSKRVTVLSNNDILKVTSGKKFFDKENNLWYEVTVDRTNQKGYVYGKYVKEISNKAFKSKTAIVKTSTSSIAVEVKEKSSSITINDINKSAINETDLYWLSNAMYQEARDCGDKEQLYVGQVIINRTKKYHASVREVLAAKNQYPTTYQKICNNEVHATKHTIELAEKLLGGYNGFTNSNASKEDWNKIDVQTQNNPSSWANVVFKTAHHYYGIMK